MPTELVTEKISTAAGLRLGESIDQAIALLGKPSKRGEGELVYTLGARVKNSQEALQKARKAYPGDDRKRDSGQLFVLRPHGRYRSQVHRLKAQLLGSLKIRDLLEPAANTYIRKNGFDCFSSPMVVIAP